MGEARVSGGNGTCEKTLRLVRGASAIVRISHREVGTSLYHSDRKRSTYTSTFDSMLFSDMTGRGK